MSQQTRVADVILRGGRVHTVDAKDRVVEAVAVAGDRILAVGSDTEVEVVAGPETRVVDLAGRTVLPGFVEAHNHMTGFGAGRVAIDCKAPGIDSIAALKREIAERAHQAPPGEWIRARGYNQTRLAEGRHPNRFDLDEAAPDHPVIVTRTCGHIAAVNSRALVLAGIDDTTPDPPGGRFDRVDGRNAGVAYEAALGPLNRAAAPSREEVKEALARTNQEWLRAGITSSHDAGMGREQIAALLECIDEGTVQVRVYFTVRLALGADDGFTYLETGLRTGFGNARAKLGPFKLMVDGSSSGPTAATRAPYTSNPQDSGMLYYTQEEVDAIVEQAHRAGFQVTAHAVGDRAIEMMIAAYERVLEKYPRKDHRHRIEHCAMCPPDLVARIARLGVVPVIQPAFFWEFGDGYLANYGVERTGHMFPARSFIDAGVIAAGSSDAPVTDVRPLFGIQQALTRTTMAGKSVGESETITLTEAIRLFTYNGAYAAFEEREKGSLEPGKLADLTVLNGTIDQVPPEEIGSLTVAATLIGGEVVHGSL
ncbi:MAG TPA: amidohydrolase [Chloroflexota bacterium]|nr:amidohydrolase [Chloroflexota bacterium]